MSPRLTLSMNERVIRRAKRYARRNGISVSVMVQRFLEMVTAPQKEPDPPPVLARLRGSLRRKAKADRHRYLEKKYR
jgi:hypothetical protein